MSEALIKAARAALNALTDERMGTCDYMDGDQIYSDFEKVADILRAALAEFDASLTDPTKISVHQTATGCAVEAEVRRGCGVVEFKGGAA